MLLRYHLQILFIFLVPINALAKQPIAFVDKLENAFDLAPYVEYIEDPGHSFTYDDIVAGKLEHLWTSNKNPYLITNSNKSRYWFRLSIAFSENSLKNDPILYVPHLPQAIYQLDIWIGTQGNSKFFSTGHLRPYESRDIKEHFFSFNFPHGTSDFTIIGWTAGQEIGRPTIMPLQVLSRDSWVKEIKTNQQRINSFYAVMLALLFYNTFLFFSLRAKVYGVYLLFLISATALTSTFDGTVMSLLSFESTWFSIHLSYLGIILTPIFYLLFVWLALDGISFSPILKKLFIGLFTVGILFIILNLVSSSMYLKAQIGHKYMAICIMASFITIVSALKKRISIAFYLFFAEICAIAGSVAFLGVMKGYFPVNGITIWGLHWGFASEAILLSFALASRTRLAQQEALEAKETALNNLMKYEALYEDAIEGLFQFSMQDKKLSCNLAFANMLGFDSIQECIDSAKNFRLQDALDKEQSEVFIKQLTESKQLKDYELNIYDKVHNCHRWVSISARLINDETRFFTIIEGSMIDINDRKEREKAEKKAIENLHRAVELKTEFLSTMSHELRTPLNGIFGYLDLLKDEDDLKQIRIMIDDLRYSASIISRQIERILVFSQLQSGSVKINLKPFNLHHVLASLEEKYKKQCDAKGLTFVIERNSDLPTNVQGDENKIYAILDDLLCNALQFTSNGAIKLKVSSKLKSKLSDINDCERHSFLFSIQDTGIGIENKVREKIFYMFSQADGSFSRRQGGLGLGLSMCKRYSDLMGGSLTLQSTVGKGSRFDWIVDLNIDKSNTVNSEQSLESNSSTPINHANILIVEDNLTNQMVLSGILKKLGHSSEVAGNGEIALEAIDSKIFDAIFMDCQMPVMDGFEAARRIRSNNHEIPIIAVTANAMYGDRERCLDAGMNDYIPKPIKRELVQKKLDAWLRAR